MTENKGPLGELFGDQMQGDLDAEGYYQRLKVAGKLKSALVGEYRCESGCLLMHTFRTPNGLAFYLPKYRLPPELNAGNSSEGGRAANTQDGAHKWNAQCGLLMSARNLEVNCDHLRLRKLDLDPYDGPEGGGVRRVIIRAE